MKITCEKLYLDLPFAHRQPVHEGHCRYVHGHNWSARFTFQATSLDKCGFVIDFGGLGWLKEWLNHMFDHTTVLNEDDPLLPIFRETVVGELGRIELYDLRVVKDCSCEGLAQLIFVEVTRQLQARTDFRVSLASVTLYEDSKNSATVIA